MHTLALKRRQIVLRQPGDKVHIDMVKAAIPRQRKSVQRLLRCMAATNGLQHLVVKALGNLENVGWCKPGYDCLYNVYMMDETHTVLAVGAGAVTKLRGQNSGMIERIYNYKYPYEYIRNCDTLLERKKRIPGFYAEYD